MILSRVGTLQNEVKSCNLRVEDTHICTVSYIYGHGQIRLVDCSVQHADPHIDPHTEWFLNSKGIIHCSQRGQPSHATFEGEGRIVLH